MARIEFFRILLEGTVDSLSTGSLIRNRPGFFTRGSHTRENDKKGVRVHFLSFPRMAAARGIPIPLPTSSKIDNLEEGENRKPALAQGAERLFISR